MVDKRGDPPVKQIKDELLELLSNGSLISPAAKIGTFKTEKKRIPPPGIVFRQKGAAVVIIS